MRPGHIITHKGVITAINPLKVEIITEGACAGCRAKGYCSLSEKRGKKSTVSMLRRMDAILGARSGSQHAYTFGI